MLFFAGIFYSVCSPQQELFEKVKDIDTTIDAIQQTIIILSVVLAYYCYGIQKLDDNTFLYPELQDSYDAEEKKGVNQVIEDADKITNDVNNVTL